MMQIPTIRRLELLLVISFCVLILGAQASKVCSDMQLVLEYLRCGCFLLFKI